MKNLFSYFQDFSLPKVCKTRLQADFVTNNQIFVIKIIKIRPHVLFRPLNFSNPSPVYSDPPSPTPSIQVPKVDKKISQLMDFSRFWDIEANNLNL